LNQQDWQARNRHLSRQITTITGQDLKLWVFAFVVVLILAAGVLVLGFSNLIWTKASRSAVELAAGLVSLVLIFAGYVFYKRHTYTRTREELMREIIYSEKLQSLSLIDPLTQTFNICYLDHVLPREINRANRHGTTLTFMLIELAGWTRVVERRGRVVGDQMLVGTGQFLKSTFRGSDIVLRYGIKRFLVIMPETNERQANCAQQRMLDRLDPWLLESNMPFELDLRFGMAAYAPGADANAVVKLAEERLKAEQSPDKSGPLQGELAGSAFALHPDGVPRKL